MPTARELGVHVSARAAALTDAGDIVVVADDDGLVLLDGATLAPRVRFEVGARVVYDTAVSRDGALVAAAERDGGASVWRADGALVAELRGHSQRVPSVSFSPDGVWLVSASWDASVRLWHVPSMALDAAAIAARVETLGRELDLTLDDLLCER